MSLLTAPLRNVFPGERIGCAAWFRDHPKHLFPGLLTGRPFIAFGLELLEWMLEPLQRYRVVR